MVAIQTQELGLSLAFGATLPPLLWGRFVPADRIKSWIRKSAQDDKWSFCLKAAMMAANRRNDEQTTAPMLHACRLQR